MNPSIDPAASGLPLQHASVRVLHSSEREGLTPVFGTSVPPSGLSGRLRSLAFRFGEGDLRHWMLLLLADRINVGEGLLSDLARGRLPNLFDEMGLATEWRHRRGPFVRRVLGWSVLGALALYALRRQRH
jgi:hypothetical protein